MFSNINFMKRLKMSIIVKQHNMFVQIITFLILFGKILNEKNETRPEAVELAFNKFNPVNGSRETTPVIFLHGITASKESWADLPQLVADVLGRKVYAIDARNHGDSPWTTKFNFNLNALDLNHFMNEIKAEKAIIIGHSMGGITSMKFALKWPRKVEKLIIEDMTAKLLPQKVCDNIIGYLKICQKAVKKIPPGTPIKTAEHMVLDLIFSSLPDKQRSLLKPSAHFKIPLQRNYDRSYSFKTNFKLLIQKLKDVNKVYPEIKEGVYDGPSCFIYGENSPIQVWKDKDLIKGFFPKAQFFGIKHASHGVHSDNPVDFRKTLFHCLKE